MAYVFNINEILEMAEQIERNGVALFMTLQRVTLTVV